MDRRTHLRGSAHSDCTTHFHRTSGRPPNVPDHEELWNQSGSIHRPTGHLEVWPWMEFTETITVTTRSLDS